MFDTIIKLITFIPWVLYFIEIMMYRINIIESKSLDKNKYFSYINKNLFKSINVKEILLYCIFILFIQYENTLVLEILFSAIYVYLLIDFFHSLAADCTKIKNKWLMVQAVLVVVLLVGMFVLSKHLYSTYNLMFGVSILSSFLVFLFSTIYGLFRKLIKKD